MIVKILSRTARFSAVRYNTDKVDKNAGELMRIRNFGLLDNDFALSPEEVRNYLKTFSASNKNVKSPQFHATISCKGREFSKEELSEIAEDWMKGMGYGNNPYIVVFHNDTQNHHVHIVSTRIDIDGKKINDSSEYYRAIRNLETVLKLDTKQAMENEINRIEAFRFSSKAQLRLLFEMAGYGTEDKDGAIQVYKKGEKVRSYDQDWLKLRFENNSKDEKRIAQLRQIISRYGKEIDNTLVAEYQKLKGGRTGEQIGYRSDLTDFLRDKFGLQFIFHFKEGKLPYGYTLIDNKGKSVLKGGELMRLGDLLKVGSNTENVPGSREQTPILKHFNVESVHHLKLLSRYYKMPQYRIEINGRRLDTQQTSYYRDLLKFFLGNNPFEELERLNITPIRQSGNWYLLDTGAMNILDAKEVLPREYMDYLNHNAQRGIHFETNGSQGIALGWDIAADQDDEKAYGKKRNRDSGKKRKT